MAAVLADGMGHRVRLLLHTTASFEKTELMAAVSANVMGRRVRLLLPYGMHSVNGDILDRYANGAGHTNSLFCWCFFTGVCRGYAV
ncbi:hypothetical protein BaRGS_00006325 [Batillaria attramentaria]|uniref:Uncharacterized protein n=1 Tax=Batillaria attramentaria TaxID=370345 RepID=A0ABD0LSN5_9CAEN